MSVPRDLDAVRYPRLAAYLRGLPQGLASYPTCVAKVTLLRAALENSMVPPRGGLPRPLTDLLHDPLVPTAWIPEMLSVAGHYAIADASGWDDDAVLDWSYRTNRALASSRPYRAVTTFASPSLLLHGAQLAWTTIHRGVDVAVRTSEATRPSSHHPS